ncbi:MAG: SUMF1/EgtB/PvdO family nonheme iron enzyme, partial [Anaerolineae bacterium]|nr:SUMF1/EgtB/PvdO family nonheme iron enzyme [Anaerolineae bacterium]
FARGMVAKGGESVGIHDRFEGRGRVVLTASNATQYAYQEDEVIGEGVRSVFTHHLVHGLETGEADLDGDGWVSLDELYDYVYDRVTDETPQQTPGKWTFDLQGDIVIARNPRPVVKPAELPLELQQAIESPFAGVREGAVRELDRLLRGSHLGLALAAHAALTCLVDNDSRRVSTAAAASLAAHVEAEQEAQAAKESEREEQERRAHEQAAAERLAAQKAEAERAAREKAEQERQARQRELEMLYWEVQTKVASEAWAEAKYLCQRIEALEGIGYRDVDELLGLAEAGLRQEQAQKERQARLDQLYEQARTALQQERWEEARRHCADIEALQPGYRDVDELLRAAEAGLRKEEEERQAQLAQLYEHLQAAAVQEDWAHVLALGKQIQKIAPGYRDVPAVVAQAKAQMRRLWYKRIPAWAWIVGGVALLALLIGLGGWAAGWWTKPPALGTICDESGCNGDTQTRPADGMTMVYVPAGEFEMGSTEGDDDEQPVHTVALDGFWIDQTEVTNAQYRQCVEAGDCDPPLHSNSSTRDSYYGNSTYDDYPVIHVSWFQANAYCEWAGARLPTEAEWEYAARGPNGLIYPWGNSAPNDTLLNYNRNVGDTTEAGSYLDGASWCDVQDLAGNVWEWVADWYEDYPSTAQTNPTGPAGGDYKVLRGGGWLISQSYVRAVSRYHYTPGHRTHFVGFRCVGQPGE